MLRRADGKRVKNMEAMYAMMSYFMVHRYDALNYITEYLAYAPLHDYIMKKRKEGLALSHMELILAAYVRCVAEFPLLNRFVVNKRVYARNELCVSMVVLRPGDMDGTMTKVYFDKTDTIQDVHEKVQAFLEKNRAGAVTNSLDRVLQVLLRMSFLVSFAIGVLKFLDKHNLLPKALIDASPFHNSLVISNLASIRTNYIYHHLYDFGTSSLFITMGNSERRPVEDKEGNIHLERFMPLGIVMDERICTGSYFAKVFRRLQQYMEHPELLEVPPAVVNEDY